MVKFARGLKLAVKNQNRKRLEQYINENAYDPGQLMENWGHDSVPEAIYINKYNNQDDCESWYRTVDLHVNGSKSWNFWNEDLINDMIDEGVLVNTGEYDKELVKDFVEEDSN